jgi:aryl carrier-like protein
MTEVLTDTVIRADVAEMLHRLPTELQNDEDLFEAGMESMRLMTLVERWREAGADVSFIDLAGNPTLGDWLTLLT